ncbi:hypothetical protein B14911_10682 [Bacillus sp. NRRL B-14911]|nr:hypothetical protein B14911_10682 [Bacillus sp. NRRL B-14911]
MDKLHIAKFKYEVGRRSDGSWGESKNERWIYAELFLVNSPSSLIEVCLIHKGGIQYERSCYFAVRNAFNNRL